MQKVKNLPQKRGRKPIYKPHRFDCRLTPDQWKVFISNAKSTNEKLTDYFVSKCCIAVPVDGAGLMPTQPQK
jgi:hypothetical protein